MNKIYSTGGVLLVIAAFLLGYFAHRPATVAGALYPTQLSSFPNGIQVGGGAYNQGTVYSGVNASSTIVATQFLSATDIIGYSTIAITTSAANTDLVLPASTTLSAWLPNSGDFTTLVFLNTGAAGNIGFTAGTGSLLQVASSTVNATSTPAKGVEFNVVRKPNSDIIFLASPYF